MTDTEEHIMNKNELTDVLTQICDICKIPIDNIPDSIYEQSENVKDKINRSLQDVFRANPEIAMILSMISGIKV